MVKVFWEQITAFLSRIMKVEINCCPKCMLLNDDQALNLTIDQRRLWHVGSTAAKKKMLALRWQPPHTLPIHQWTRLLVDILSMELSTATVNGASGKSVEAWETILTSVKRDVN